MLSKRNKTIAENSKLRCRWAQSRCVLHKTKLRNAMQKTEKWKKIQKNRLEFTQVK